MNAPIARLFVVVVVLFGVLVGFTSRWTVFGRRASCATTQDNRRELLEQQRIQRGVIRAADGKLLAREVRKADETLRARYPDDGCSRTRSATRSRASGAPGSSATTTTS